MTITGGTWTYSGNPAASALDQVRFLLTDTDTADQLLSDEEILWSLSQNPDVYSAAAVCANTIAGQFGRTSDEVQVGDLKIVRAARSRFFTDLSTTLFRESGRALSLAAAPYNAAISVGEKLAVTQDTDRTDPSFLRRMTDDPTNPSQDQNTPPGTILPSS